VDIIESTSEIQLAKSSISVIGTLDLAGAAVEFIDTGYYYRLAFEEAVDDTRRAGLLIFDGEPGMQDMLTPVLASAGHKVTTAGSAEQANALLQSSNFSAVIVDSKARSRLDPSALAHQDHPFCVILGDGDEELAAGEAGEQSAVISRFDRRRLLSTIAEHLAAHPAALSHPADNPPRAKAQ
jgi:DNA-binding NtrC family response regulator